MAEAAAHTSNAWEGSDPCGQTQAPQRSVLQWAHLCAAPSTPGAPWHPRLQWEEETHLCLLCWQERMLKILPKKLLPQMPCLVALGSRVKLHGRGTLQKREEGMSPGYAPIQSHPPSHQLLWTLLPLLTLFPGNKPLHSTICANLIPRGFVERRNRYEKGK